MLAAALTACGGGGGGGGGGSPRQQLQLSATQLNITSPVEGNVAPQTLTGTISGDPQAVYARVESTANGILTIAGPTVSGTSASIQIQFRQPGALGHGSYDDTITVSACRDQNCSQHYAGSPTTVQVHYVVGLATGGTSSITAQTVEGTAAASQNLNLSYYAGNGNWSGSIAFSSPSQSWLTLQPLTGSLPGSTSVGFQPLAAGTYTATINLSATGAQTQTRAIPVTYEVRPLLTGTAPAAFEVTSQNAAGSRNVTITTRDSSRNSAWTASTSAPWLQVTNGSGTTGASSTLSFELVASQLQHMRNGTYTGIVTVDPALNGASTIEVPVELVLDRTFVNTVSPYVGAANQSAQVIITGQRLSDASIQAVRFGSTAATSFQVNGATRLLATYPALPAGRYPVTIVVNGVEQGSVAELVLQDPFSYVAAGGAPPPVTSAGISVFDPERRSCYFATYFADASSSQIGALRAGASSWTSQVSPVTDLPNMTSATLTADGRELLVFSNNTIVHFDPDTLQETRRTETPASPAGYVGGNLARLDDGGVAFARDGRIYRYEPWTGTVALLSEAGNSAQRLVETRASNRIAYHTASFNANFNTIDTASGATSPLAGLPHQAVGISSDLFGQRWAMSPISTTFDTVIVDAQGVEIGRINVFNPNSNVLSDDGQTLVVAYSLGGGPSGDRYAVVDLTALGSGGVPTLRTTLSNVPSRTGALYFTPHQDEIVSCGANTGGTTIPP